MTKHRLNKILEIENQIKELRDKRTALYQSELIACTDNCFGKGCGKKTKIKDLSYIQTHYYVPPSGCTDGAFWAEGDGQFVCPKCDHVNRLYDRPELRALRSYFKEIISKHD